MERKNEKRNEEKETELNGILEKYNWMMEKKKRMMEKKEQNDREERIELWRGNCRMIEKK